jgi:hypothetical protein
VNVVYATTTTSVTNAHGVIYRINGGEAWDADDPIVQQHPDLFARHPVKARTSQGWADIETMTAKPGEKRRTKRG